MYMYVGTCTDMYCWQGLGSVFFSRLNKLNGPTSPQAKSVKHITAALVDRFSSGRLTTWCNLNHPTVQASASPRLNEQMTPRALFEMVKDDQNWAAQMQREFAIQIASNKSLDSVRFVCFRLYYWTIHQELLAEAQSARTFLISSWHIGIIWYHWCGEATL